MSICVAFPAISYDIRSMSDMRGRLTTPTHVPNLSIQSLRNSKPERPPHPTAMRLFCASGFATPVEKIPFYVGSGRIQDPKGEYVRPVSGGFLSSRRLTLALRKHPEVLMIDQRYRSILRPHFLSEVADA